jgi:hypothetical protein
LLLAWAVAGTGAFGTACGDDLRREMGPPVAGAILTADPKMLSLKTGETAVVRFLLTTAQGAPVAGERLDFVLVDDDSTSQSKPAGATLSASYATTNMEGVASVQVTGGLKTSFRLTARHQRAGAASTEVVVGGGNRGTVAVVAAPSERALVEAALQSVDLLLYEKRRCSDLDVAAPPQPTRLPRTVAPGAAAELELSADAVTAVVGHGRDEGGKLRAVGCIEVPGTAASGGSPVRVYLPLLLLIPRPGPAYALTSQVSLARREVGRRLAAPWLDLGDCPLDPGQLWLDCAVDALTTTAADPLDCVPASDEGPLAAAIAARRGQLTVGSVCRGSKSGAPGAEMDSLDAQVTSLFPNPAEPPAQDLTTLGAEAAALLDKLTITSLLTLEPTERDDVFQGTHALLDVGFLVGSRSHVVDVFGQGSPAAEARFVRVTTADEHLVVSSHGLGLGLGKLARAAFYDAALAGRSLPRETTAFVGALFGLASTAAGSTRLSGCQALDALVCARIPEQAAGCLRAACAAGQAALAARLDAAFAAADGMEIDLLMFGSAVMLDDGAGNGVADRLGDPDGGSLDGPGLWNLELRAAAGTETLSGSWTGKLLP